MKTNKNNNGDMKTTHYRQTHLRMGDIAAINEEWQYNGLLPKGYIPDMGKIQIRAEMKAIRK